MVTSNNYNSNSDNKNIKLLKKAVFYLICFLFELIENAVS
jgi:hypothetical protein